MTAAQRVQLTFRIIRRALDQVTRDIGVPRASLRGKKKGDWIHVDHKVISAWNFVEAAFPLHGTTCLPRAHTPVPLHS